MDQGMEGLKNEIRELRRTVEENTSLLQSIQRRNRFSFWFNALKWIVLVGVSFGAFYFLKPYVDTLSGTANNLRHLFAPEVQ